MKSIRLCIYVLAVSQALWPAVSQSAEPAIRPQISEEVSKQESIYHSQGQQVPEGYTIDRALEAYAAMLPPVFSDELAGLGPNDRWLDIGAGKGHAILGYYAPSYDVAHWAGREKRGRKARAVAMSIEDRRTPLWQQTAAGLGANQIQYLTNKRLREYSVEELGRFKLITDVIGGFSYSVDLSLFMEKVLSFLEVNGSFHTVLQDVHSEAGSNVPFYANAPYLTEITNIDGSKEKVCSWLKSIGCVQVTCELKTGWRPPIEAFHIQKVCNEVKVPALVPVHYQAGTPPERRYRKKGEVTVSPRKP